MRDGRWYSGELPTIRPASAMLADRVSGSRSLWGPGATSMLAQKRRSKRGQSEGEVGPSGHRRPKRNSGPTGARDPRQCRR